MIHKVYSIRDSKGEQYNPPFLQKTHGEAERSFKDLASKQDTFIHKYPEDYDLYFLGEFDDSSGKYQPLDAPQHMIKAVQLISQ